MASLQFPQPAGSIRASNTLPSDRPSSANIAGSTRGSDQNTSGSSRQTLRLVRPPVPLFAESTPSIPQPDSANMNIADFEEFTGFEGGASTAYSSPSAPSVFDMPSGSHNIGTVSPQDLLIQDPYMSAPNSTAFTALTSPSPFESPEYMDGYDVSPNFGSSGEYDVAGSQWFSLFPDQNASVETTGAEQPLGDRVQNSTVSECPRRKSSGSPASGRHSSVAGVNARKRDKPLPPIVVENPDDVVAMKRARNTLAARKSRERKMQRFEDLEEKIRKLEAERDHWKTLALGQSTSD
ncbi:cross-pathway control protein [Verticillium dahliae]|nr:cross-pathway control protein [Verticillium dahliae]KAH6700702.1 cross-pathway control protein [Verticillium dahliae]